MAGKEELGLGECGVGIVGRLEDLVEGVEFARVFLSAWKERTHFRFFSSKIGIRIKIDLEWGRGE